MHRIALHPSADPYNRFAQQVMRAVLEKHKFVVGEEGSIHVWPLDPRRHGEDITGITGEHVILHGHLPERLIPRLQRTGELVSLLTNENAHQIVELVEEMLHGSALESLAPDERTPLPFLRGAPFLYVPVQPAFDAPFLQTAISSWPKEEIVAATRRKAKVVVLTGNDLCAYGTEEIWRSSLPDLLREVLAEGDARILLGRMSVKRLKPVADEMAEILKEKRVIKRLWLALESGSNDVLARAGAGHTVEDFKIIAGKLRNAVPGLTLRTDLTIGAPGESVEEFNEALQTLRDVRPDETEIVDGSILPGRQLEAKMRDQRLKTAQDIAGNVAMLANEQWQDWGGEAIAEESYTDGSTALRNWSWKKVLLPRRYEVGSVIKVQAQHARRWGVKGEEKRL